MSEIDDIAASNAELAGDVPADIEDGRDRIGALFAEEARAPEPVGHEQSGVADAQNVAVGRRTFRPRHEDRRHVGSPIAIAIEHDGEAAGTRAPLERRRNAKLARGKLAILALLELCRFEKLHAVLPHPTDRMPCPIPGKSRTSKRLVRLPALAADAGEALLGGVVVLLDVERLGI